MQTAAHTMPPMPPPGLAQRRATGLFFAILLQVGLIAALITGLDIKVWPKPIIDSIPIKFIATKKIDYPPPKPLPWVTPTPKDLPKPPVIVIGDDRPNVIDPNRTGEDYRPGPADHGPVGIARTHTVPPYPALYARLGSQGTVILRLTISAQGAVTDTVVIRSSGTEGLDEVARAWVLQHWRYQPAIRGGVAAPGAVTVGVEFNLKNAD